MFIFNSHFFLALYIFLSICILLYLMIPSINYTILFEIKHCKIETVFILRSAQAGKLKKTYI